MRTITKEFNVYKWDELPKETQEKLIEKERSARYEYGDIEYEMNDHLEELLEQAGFTDVDVTPRYSLSYSQGDGASFTGSMKYTVDGDNYAVDVTPGDRSNFYAHKYTIDIDITDEDGEDAPSQVADKVESTILDICDKLEAYGYSLLEEWSSEEAAIEYLERLEYLGDGSVYYE